MPSLHKRLSGVIQVFSRSRTETQTTEQVLDLQAQQCRWYPYSSRLHLAPQVIQTRFQGSRLGLLPWRYTFKEIRAGRQQGEAAAGKTQGACSANMVKVTALKREEGAVRAIPISSQSKAGDKGSSGGGEWWLIKHYVGTELGSFSLFYVIVNYPPTRWYSLYLSLQVQSLTCCFLCSAYPS